MSAAGLDLLNRLLTYDPARRLTARAAVRHPYLTAEAPLPKRPTDMPTFPSAHDQDARGWHARRSPPQSSPLASCSCVLRTCAFCGARADMWCGDRPGQARMLPA